MTQHSGVRCIVIVACCTLLAVLLLPCIQPPFGVVFAALALASLLCCIFIKKTWVTYTTMVLLPLFAVVAFMEFHLLAVRAPSEPTQDEGTFRSTVNHKDPVRGYGAQAEKSATVHRVMRGSTKLFECTYTMDEQGCRVTPVHPQAKTAVVFFGCSYTFGLGVEDNETYPYKVAELLGVDYQVINMAFTGYGSHQMLAALESGALDDIARRYKKVHVYYLNIPMHEMRPAGYAEWDTHGPKYVLENGKAVRAGNFDHWWSKEPLGAKAYETLKKSFLFMDFFVRPREWKLKQLRPLDNAIIRKAQDLVLSKYPNCDFTLLVYPGAAHHLPLQKEMGLHPVDTTPFFSLPPSDPRYVIQGDGHPSPEAHRVLATGIADHVKKR